jgi:hypothetical protein
MVMEICQMDMKQHHGKKYPLISSDPHVYHMAQDAGIGWVESNAKRFSR